MKTDAWRGSEACGSAGTGSRQAARAARVLRMETLLGRLATNWERPTGGGVPAGRKPVSRALKDKGAWRRCQAQRFPAWPGDPGGWGPAAGRGAVPARPPWRTTRAGCGPRTAAPSPCGTGGPRWPVLFWHGMDWAGCTVLGEPWQGPSQNLKARPIRWPRPHSTAGPRVANDHFIQLPMRCLKPMKPIPGPCCGDTGKEAEEGQGNSYSIWLAFCASCASEDSRCRGFGRCQHPGPTRQRGWRHWTAQTSTPVLWGYYQSLVTHKEVLGLQKPGLQAIQLRHGVPQAQSRTVGHLFCFAYQ
jgi:hypothetical protein